MISFLFIKNPQYFIPFLIHVWAGKKFSSSKIFFRNEFPERQHCQRVLHFPFSWSRDLNLLTSRKHCKMSDLDLNIDNLILRLLEGTFHPFSAYFSLKRLTASSTMSWKWICGENSLWDRVWRCSLKEAHPTISITQGLVGSLFTYILRFTVLWFLLDFN